jgi:hypothetical protein
MKFYGAYLTMPGRGCQAQISETPNLNPAHLGINTGIKAKSLQ